MACLVVALAAVAVPDGFPREPALVDEAAVLEVHRLGATSAGAAMLVFSAESQLVDPYQAVLEPPGHRHAPLAELLARDPARYVPGAALTLVVVRHAADPPAAHDAPDTPDAPPRPQATARHAGFAHDVAEWLAGFEDAGGAVEPTFTTPASQMLRLARAAPMS